MYGWKGRIGLLIPHRCTTMEPEFTRLVPDGVSVHAHRMVLQETSVRGIRKMQKEILRSSLVINAINPGVIIMGCTAGSMVGGAKYDEKMISDISRVTGTTAITTSSALIAALKSYEVQRVAVGTPYTDEMNGLLRAFLEREGFIVTKIKGLGYSESITSFPLSNKPVSGIGLLSPMVAYRLACDVNSEEAEAVLISCTNLRTIEIIEPLEQNLGKPVVTSNQATFALAMHTMGIKEHIKGYGSLLEKDIL